MSEDKNVYKTMWEHLRGTLVILVEDAKKDAEDTAIIYQDALDLMEGLEVDFVEGKL